MHLLGSDAIDSQVADEAPALKILVRQVGSEQGENDEPGAAAIEAKRGNDGIDLFVEQPADGEVGAHPQGAAGSVGQNKLPERHAADARQSDGDQAHARDELRKQERV